MPKGPGFAFGTLKGGKERHPQDEGGCHKAVISFCLDVRIFPEDTHTLSDLFRIPSYPMLFGA